MSFIKFEEKRYSKKKRPTNQSSPEVIEKITKRISKLSLDENSKPSKPQEILSELVKNKKSPEDRVPLKENEIDIAHNIAIDEMINVVTDRMNHPIENDTEALNFVDDIISTESEESRCKAKKFFNELVDKTIPIEEQIKRGDEVVSRFNRSSKNLMPGFASPNRSIKTYRDPHLFYKNGELEETEISKRLTESSYKFFGEEYSPKIRVNSEGEEFYQSSSIHKNSKHSYYKKPKLVQPNISLSESSDSVDDALSSEDSNGISF